jgi:hypothetical protein
VVWAGANLGSYQQASSALQVLAGVALTIKQVQRITSQFGGDVLREREALVAEHRQRPLMDRVKAAPGVKPAELAVVMMDGGRFQRRDDFRPRAVTGMSTSPRPGTGAQPSGSDSADAKPENAAPANAPENATPENATPANTSENTASASAPPAKKTHWREDKVGVVLTMNSKVHAQDPTPEFPDWLAGARVVAELAKLTARDESHGEAAAEADARAEVSRGTAAEEPQSAWPDLAPELVSREVVASSDDAESFGWHLEWKAWTQGVPAAKRQAFVADGLAVNWSIHRRHFSQMTGILDLMHALSYAWRVAAALDDPTCYARYARWIWQGKVVRVIEELREHQQRLNPPDAATTNPAASATLSSPASANPSPIASASASPTASATPGTLRSRVDRALTYYENHQRYMDYPKYRQQGLPLTSSHMESTVKLMNARIKGSEKFWRADYGDHILELRADSLSDSQPLTGSWIRWRAKQTGANRYRKTAA